jgi:hypothetical protein
MEEINLEVSSSALDGIKLLNNVINEETSRKLIVNAVKQLLINGPGGFFLKKLFIFNSLISSSSSW